MSVRLRLTLLYGGLFLLASALLLGITLGLVRSTLHLPFSIVIPDPGPSSRTTLFYRRPLDAFLYQQLAIRFGIALGVMAVASLGLGWVTAGRVLRPLHDITAAAKRLSGQNLHERINLQGPDDELKELANTFDAMLGRLDAAFDSQRRFVANASHELRTPLAIARTELDVTLASRRAALDDFRAMAERVRDATQRSERLIDSLLLLAVSERELDTRDLVDLAAVTAEALSHPQAEIARRRLRVTQALGVAPVTGDRSLLDRLVGNLVENAVRHNQPNGWIEVSTAKVDGQAEVRVANSGPPIPADQVHSLFEPFHRLDGRTRSSQGVGLGLSIVRAVASAHGGEVAAYAPPHGGLEVIVRLPAPAQPAPITQH